ncbi:MAG: hypothetical protein IPM42_21960 [Saprospiraceae bacterium]|nr:hypothetical protein [Saprospiraceae bacterium]
MNLRDKIKSTLLRFGGSISNEIKEELKQQGHVNTGKLSNSILFGVSENGNDMNLDVSMLDYHVFIEKGVQAKRIPFGGRSTGRKTSKYIEGLIAFSSKGKIRERSQKRSVCNGTRSQEGGNAIEIKFSIFGQWPPIIIH